MSKIFPNSQSIYEHNRRYIPGAVVSTNRIIDPALAFARGRGSRIWDVDGNEYIDYHAAFSPHILGHNPKIIAEAIHKSLEDEESLIGAGTNRWEGRLAELLVTHIPSVDKVQITNSGSEATYHAIRIARAHTGRDGVVIMQGGYNGWHNDVAYNVMNPVAEVGERVSPGEYPLLPLSAGIPGHVQKDVHVVNFNDLESMEHVFRRDEIAAVILEPVLQNIGVVPPRAGYLEGLRSLCDREGVVLIFDEVKTGFRHALGGYQSLAGVMPDLSTFGKAMANGYSIGAIGGKTELMNYFTHENPRKRVMMAGTYNAHPIPVAASIATIEYLANNAGEVYPRLDALGLTLEDGLAALFREFGQQTVVSRQGSAFCVYFMDRVPVDWHDVLENHDFDFDRKYRRSLIEEGIFHFPLPTKQGSISAAHTDEDIQITLERTRRALKSLHRSPARAAH